MRDNPTQRALIRASACRLESAMLEHVRVREAIRPIAWRRLMRLAAMIQAQPIAPRRRANRGRLKPLEVTSA
jgi:hypothetical protein